MYKVIIVDNLNRDYQSQGLVTMAISENLANLIAKTFNDKLPESSPGHFKAVPANQELDLQSMYDLTGETMPYEHWLKLTGADALPEHVAKYWYSTTILKKTISNEEQEWL